MIDKISLMNRARIAKRRVRDSAVIETAGQLFEKYKNEPLFISGIALYWAEGTRLSQRYRKYQLAFTNSDPALISFYRNFLERYFCQIHKNDWRAELFLYPDIDPAVALTHWSNTLNIPRTQFIKSQVLSGKSDNGKKLSFGTCRIYVNSKDACLTMQAWIEAVTDSLRR